jgi:hypothetical protein
LLLSRSFVLSALCAHKSHDQSICSFTQRTWRLTNGMTGAPSLCRITIDTTLTFNQSATSLHTRYYSAPDVERMERLGPQVYASVPSLHALCNERAVLLAEHARGQRRRGRTGKGTILRRCCQQSGPVNRQGEFSQSVNYHSIHSLFRYFLPCKVRLSTA